MKKIRLKDLAETLAYGEKLAKHSQGGDILALNGPLGSGKTSLAQGIAKGLNIKERINSPTFNIIKIYLVKGDNKIKEFIHIDAYRLKSSQELLSLGIEDIFNRKDVIVLIEWSEKIKDILPTKARIIKIDYYNKNKERIIFV